MTKDTVPQDYTLGLAIFDAVPVILFGLASGLFRPAPILFVIIIILGMTAMIRFSAKLDPADLKANWIEQTCNTVAQGAFFAAVLLVALN